ncbi:MAG: anthranilate phosphoribosyltransferase [Chloroflexota bacterium]|nr:anthranilate phosphoribosyltransferase [Chloroflexota bacterium]
MGTSTGTDVEIREAIRAVVDGRELSADEATAAMDAIMGGHASGAQIGALVTALRMRGETVEEIAGFARAMRGHALRVEVPRDGRPLVDTCGTGGDASGTFNISTTASFAIAGAGVRVAKHGNRAVTSRCGSADLLEGLGVAIELSPAAVARCVEEVGIGFMYAPAFHPAMRFVGPARREIGIRTVFNILGPLTNPAGARHQLVGVGHPDVAGKLAAVLARLGSERAILVHAEEGLDEIGIGGPSAVTEFDARDGDIRTYRVAPEEFGLPRASASELRGGDVAENVAITRGILSGDDGPRCSVTLLNAGAGIYAANAAPSFADGIAMAAEAIDSGRALATLNHLAALSQDLVRTTGAAA